MSTTFSVIVPIYKVEKYLNKCIDSTQTEKIRKGKRTGCCSRGIAAEKADCRQYRCSFNGR